MKGWIVAVTLAGLSGCASLPELLQARQAGGPLAPACAKPNQEQNLELNLARDMAAEGRLHAALAHLQGLPDSLPDVRLGKAQLLRRLDRSEARGLYQSLLDTCLSAAGHHGLGQLAVSRGDLREAELQLGEAARLEPTDARIRNDLGVLYLRQGRVEAARFELLTALELNQAQSRPAINLLALLLYQERWEQAAKLIDKVGLSSAQTRSAEALARELGASSGAALPLADAGPVLNESSKEVKHE
ncbi:tetratricopeptide repeat protein [Pseudomonas sp. LRF_L74]|uniref:tetratricopeptide repeat protein n=1 Tax=Pseudomonas sp. LRF_L74 TaxID=3369422 RepID=UPI003F60FC72